LPLSWWLYLFAVSSLGMRLSEQSPSTQKAAPAADYQKKGPSCHKCRKGIAVILILQKGHCCYFDRAPAVEIVA